MVFLLSACAVQRDVVDVGPEKAQDVEPAKTKAVAPVEAASRSLGVGKLEDWVRSACLREASSLRRVDTISEKLMCKPMFEGLVDSAAEMGRRLEGSKYCVAQGFDTGAYQEAMVTALRVEVIRGRAFTDHALGQLKSDDPEKDSCNWASQRKLGALVKKCQWFRAATASDRNAALRDLMRRSGIRSAEKFKQKLVENASDCTGYYTGYMAASFFEGYNSAYCADSVRGNGPLDGGDDIMMQKLAALTENLEEALDSKPGRSNEPVSPHLYPLMVDAFPCGG